MPKIIKVIFTPRMLIALLMGFSSGLPLMLATGSTLQAWMTDAKVDLKTIGLFSLVGLPYTFKFLWAPVFDYVTLPWLGKRRGWLLVSQIFLTAAIAAIGLWNPTSSPSILAALCVIAAFFSASQDVVIDAYRTEGYSSAEQGLASSLYTNGYRFAMLFTGAIGLILADHMGWRQLYLLMAGCMALGILVTIFSPEPKPIEKPPTSITEAVIAPFTEFLTRNGAWIILAFILLYKVGDTMAGALTTKFYLDIGFTKTQIGAIAKSVGLIATLSGAFVGGILMLNLGVFRSLWIFGILQAASTFGFSFLSKLHVMGMPPIEILPSHISLLSGVIAFENFTGGMGTSAYSAYMASQTNQRFTATQYALLSGLMSVPRTVLASTSGYLVEGLGGWYQYYIFCGLLAIPGLLLLYWMRPKNKLDNSTTVLGLA